MDANQWNALLAGGVTIALGLAAIAGFAWNIRRGVTGYASEIRAHFKRIGSPYASDERGLWMLAVTKLAGVLSLGIVMVIGGAILICLAVGD